MPDIERVRQFIRAVEEDRYLDALRDEYCWVFRLDGGRIKEVTEYMDTKLAEAVLA